MVGHREALLKREGTMRHSLMVAERIDHYGIAHLERTP